MKKSNENVIYKLIIIMFISSCAGIGYWYLWVHGSLGMWLSYMAAGLTGSLMTILMRGNKK